MEIKAKLNHLRISPRKVRLVADLIRNMEVTEAESQLKFMPKRSTDSLLKLLNSAVANAKNNFNLEKKDLYIKKIIINQGPPFKRWRAASRGRAMPIIKRTSHVNLVLGAKEGVKVEKKTIEKAKSVQASPPQSEDLGKKPEEPKEEEKPKTKDKSKRAPKKISKKPSFKGLAKKVFRRKSF